MKFAIATLALSAAQVSAFETQVFPVDIIGSEGDVPDTAFPLGKCQGDCNRNIDCEGTLLCFARGGATTIPGCEGELPMDGTDVCWDPNDRMPEGVIANIGRNGNPPQLFPLQRCQGTCLQDTDCAEGLVCYFRSAVVNTVPGCDGEPLPDGADYCVRPEDLPYGVGGVTPPAPTTPVEPEDPVVTTTTEPPVGETEPTVTENSNTTEPLATVAVTEIPDNFLAVTYNSDGPTSSLPLMNCEGDCGADEDCDGDLVCFQRNFNEPVPGCVGLALDYYDYCVEPDATAAPVDATAPILVAPAGLLSVVFSNGSPAAVLPLQHCHGDCDSDADCDEGLTCFLRESEDVPGCDGAAANDIDYCIKTEDIPAQIEATSSVPNVAVAKATLAALVGLMFL